jgi:hypothetical protein
MRAGADDVLLRPINLDEAREVFTRVMEHPRFHRSARPHSARRSYSCISPVGPGATTLAVNSPPRLHVPEREPKLPVTSTSGLVMPRACPICHRHRPCRIHRRSQSLG